jgi:(1->4)-alpha-D-glucan 1-alpha-D-glucosylmutase
VSPFLKARPGSLHGYDVIDHQQLNPEIGTRDDLDRLFAALREFEMGLIVDVVPNHMGVLGSDNAWWLDVLENGRASPYANFFDIDWDPLKAELRGKVLLPVLDGHYGTLLDRGALRLTFESERGEFGVNYEQHRFPLDPSTYPDVLRLALDRMHAGDRGAGALNRLLAAYATLPSRDVAGAHEKAQRRAQQQSLRQELAALCATRATLRTAIEEAMRECNGNPGEPPSFCRLHELLSAQAYRLAYWRVAADEINYRRFFDINDLAALRMEDAAVFDATHSFLFELIGRGPIDGLRIDHPDGLYDPGQYFRRLQERWAQLPRAASGPLYVVAEKITAAFEHLPVDWAVHGTTGYRFANLSTGVSVDAASEAALNRFYVRFSGQRQAFDDVVHDCKQLVMQTSLASELSVLARGLARIAEMRGQTRDFTLNTLREALLQVVAYFPVYRTYLTEAGLHAEDRRHIEWAVARARKHSQAADPSVFDFVRGVLTAEIAEGETDDVYRRAVLAFAQRFQQFTAPAMAKGFEDTACYRYNRLLSLNDVGGDPKSFGISLAALHAASADRAKSWPHTMLSTSTHDSKRSEDARDRINVISEMADDWRRAVRRWSRINRSKKRSVDELPAPSRNDEYYLYQSLLAVWPLAEINQDALDELRERMTEHMRKAIREAKVHTSWINTNSEYEQAFDHFVGALLGRLDGNAFVADFAVFARRCARFGLLNGLSRVLIKLTSPGVPDFYQGSELWSLRLADPDNRQPVDYGPRRQMLEALALECDAAPDRGEYARELALHIEDGRAKLFLIWRALLLRSKLPAWFESGDYVALAATGTQRERLCAFARMREGQALLTLAPRHWIGLLDDPEQPSAQAWDDTELDLEAVGPTSEFVNALTGERVSATRHDGRIRFRIGELLTQFPVGLFVAAPLAELVH